VERRAAHLVSQPGVRLVPRLSSMPMPLMARRAVALFSAARFDRSWYTIKE